MATADEAAIQRLTEDLTDAWNRGDWKAYGARFHADGTFTNVNGTFFVGREEFDRRHEDAFRRVYKGTTIASTIKMLRFIRPDVAVIDVDLVMFGWQGQPRGAQAGPDGAFHTCLLMVLVKEDGSWWIAAFHNVWRSAGA